jgi:putative restriction endonuclease
MNFHATTTLIFCRSGRLRRAFNGLMLPPQADFLFDRGLITFSDGRLLISEVAHEASLVKLGVDPDRPPEGGSFTREQEAF